MLAIRFFVPRNDKGGFERRGTTRCVEAVARGRLTGCVEAGGQAVFTKKY